VTVHFADSREVKADILIGADGVHSAVRAALFGPAPLRYRGYTAVRSLTPAGSVPLSREGIETWGQGARFGVAPTRGDRIIWYASWNTPAGGEHDGGLRACLRMLFGGWHDPIPAVIEATPEDAIVRNDIYDRWPARTWTRGRVALIGDAIHPMTPDLAQGACQAFEDAVALASVLDTDVPAALARYDALRRARTSALQRQCRQMHRVLTLRGPAGRLRDTVLRRVPTRFATRALAAQMGFTPQSVLH
jgi:2-polyprenyl-6-methoxyphenol hydroxylase-like FAD-dependent oxidoreductase